MRNLLKKKLKLRRHHKSMLRRASRMKAPLPLIIVIIAAIFGWAELEERLNTETLSGSVYVHDGDTIILSGTKMRLQGIDAPELGQSCKDNGGKQWPCGKEAKAMLQRIASRPITCTWKEKDDYGRSLATCFDGDTNINQAMVRSGFALAFRRYSTAYVSDEKKAERQKIGVWQGEFTEPWEYRRRSVRNLPRN